MTASAHVDVDTGDLARIGLDRIDLSDRDFWVQPPAMRHAVFDALRRERPFAFYAEPEVPMLEPGPRPPGGHPVRRPRGARRLRGRARRRP